MRCGTSAFFDWISAHPDVRPSSTKEIHFFDHNYHRGERWYRSFFSLRAPGTVSFEATPSYLVNPMASKRARSLVPDTKIVVILRDPVDRAWSHYRFRRARGIEPRAFEEVIQDELAADEPGPAGGFWSGKTVPYLVAGRYADQLPGWIEAFGTDRVLIIDADAMFTRSDEVFSEVCDFVGIQHMSIPLKKVNAAPSDNLDPSMRSILGEYYEQHNRRLGDLVDIPAGWLDR
jgi:hypothetical protein